jgi:organic hydroperoxide reductase OsmC/OhrA
MSEYTATIKWRRDEQDFLGGNYSRGHVWEFDGGVSVPATASPHIVPPPKSVAGNVDPEQAFVASLSSCHMLFFLSIAAKKGYVVDTYTDYAIGYLAKNDQGKYAMTRVRLRPQVSFSGDKLPTMAQNKKIHEESHEHCFIANSVTTEVIVEPQG